MNRINRRVALLILAAAMFAATGIAQAQEATTVVFAILPKVGVSGSFTDPPRPKYLRELSLAGPSFFFSAKDYGKQDVMLAGANLTDAQRVSLASHVDAFVFPADLDSTISASVLATVRSTVEGWKLPGNQIDTTWTWRQAIGFVGRIFYFSTAFDGIARRSFFEGNATLDTRVRNLATGNEEAFKGAWAQLGLPANLIGNQTTVREAFLAGAPFLPTFTLEGVTFP
jgi:hypothetical protein